MNPNEHLSIVDRYLTAYNAFDIGAMMATVHQDVEFKNVSSGLVNATASGKEEFRRLAEQSKQLFSSRNQTIRTFKSYEDKAVIEVTYEAVLALDLPNGMKAGETLRLNGRSEFVFRDGRIYQLADYS